MSYRVLVAALTVIASVSWIGAAANAQQKPGVGVASTKSTAVSGQKTAKPRPETAERSAVVEDQSKVKTPEAKNNPR
jgi:hypothetical protein